MHEKYFVFRVKPQKNFKINERKQQKRKKINKMDEKKKNEAKKQLHSVLLIQLFDILANGLKKKHTPVEITAAYMSVNLVHF